MLIRESYSNKTKYYVRFIYDVSCFMIINITLMNIIFGIIIDTFAELRDKKFKQEEDKSKICFVCSLDRHLFDKTADGYEAHFYRDHNIWHYLFYLYHLNIKEETEYDGIESYVNKMI